MEVGIAVEGAVGAFLDVGIVYDVSYDAVCVCRRCLVGEGKGYIAGFGNCDGACLRVWELAGGNGYYVAVDLLEGGAVFLEASYDEYPVSCREELVVCNVGSVVFFGFVFVCGVESFFGLLSA